MPKTVESFVQHSLSSVNPRGLSLLAWCARLRLRVQGNNGASTSVYRCSKMMIKMVFEVKDSTESSERSTHQRDSLRSSEDLSLTFRSYSTLTAFVSVFKAYHFTFSYYFCLLQESLSFPNLPNHLLRFHLPSHLISLLLYYWMCWDSD